MLAQDLEELIRQQGEDIDFEFYFDGKLVLANQSMFEVFKGSESKQRASGSSLERDEQTRALMLKEEELRKAARKIAEEGGPDSERRIMALKRESDRIREMIYQAQASHSGPPRGPPGFLTGLAGAHKVYFCIADKTDEVSDLRQSRLDSLGELTG